MVERYKISENASDNQNDTVGEPTKFLFQKFSTPCSFGIDWLMKYGRFREWGWEYDLTPYLKKYLYRQHGQWHEAFAPNKTLLRKSVFGRIEKIVSIT